MVELVTMVEEKSETNERNGQPNKFHAKPDACTKSPILTNLHELTPSGGSLSFSTRLTLLSFMYRRRNDRFTLVI